MRVSERQRYEITNSRVEQAKSTNTKMLENISTLKKINKISDDPVGVSKVIRLRDRIKNGEQFQKNLEFSRGYLDRAETALSAIQDNLIRAKELSVALSSSNYDGSSRSATAREVQEILNEVVQLANSTYANRFIFSGFRTHTPTLSEDGSYLGDDGSIYLQVDENDMRQINIQARYLFEASPEEKMAGHFNMVDCLEILRHGLDTDDTEMIRKAMTELDFQIDKAIRYRAKYGALSTSLESVQSRLELMDEKNREEMSNIEEADLFRVSSDFKRSESILQSTLLASNKMLQPSLLNFMQ